MWHNRRRPGQYDVEDDEEPVERSAVLSFRRSLLSKYASFGIPSQANPIESSAMARILVLDMSVSGRSYSCLTVTDL